MGLLTGALVDVWCQIARRGIYRIGSRRTIGAVLYRWAAGLVQVCLAGVFALFLLGLDPDAIASSVTLQVQLTCAAVIAAIFGWFGVTPPPPRNNSVLPPPVSVTAPVPPRVGQRALADAAAHELHAGTYVPALWERACLESAGDLARARSLYIESRVATLVGGESE
jgi:hypothetical protein